MEPPLTAHQVVAIGIERFGGNVKLADRIRLRELTGADGLGAQVKRWALDDGPRVPGDVAIRILDELGAIDWRKVVGHPGSAEDAAARIDKKVALARSMIEGGSPGQAREGSRP